MNSFYRIIGLSIVFLTLGVMVNPYLKVSEFLSPVNTFLLFILTFQDTIPLLKVKK